MNAKSGAPLSGLRQFHDNFRHHTRCRLLARGRTGLKSITAADCMRAGPAPLEIPCHNRAQRGTNKPRAGV